MIGRIAVLALALASGTAWAQTQDVEVEPVTCWWRSSAAAVRVGERFTVALTCSVLQTEAARAVVEESRLEPAVVQLAPFDVTGGIRATDVTTAGRRFIQYEYAVRLLAENLFGSEVRLPALELTYRVESRVDGGESLAGRDLTYALPPLALRVLSMVPDTALDIREAPVASFAVIEGVASRGRLLRVGGGVLIALGALLLAMAGVGAVQRRRAGRRTPTPALSTAALLKAAGRDLAAVQERVRASGWDADLVGRALAAARIVAACGAGLPVAQQVSARASEPGRPAAGQLAITRSGARTLASAAATPRDGGDLANALAALTAALYGRDGAFDAGLDDAVEAARAAADRLAARRPLLERAWTR